MEGACGECLRRHGPSAYCGHGPAILTGQKLTAHSCQLLSELRTSRHSWDASPAAYASKDPSTASKRGRKLYPGLHKIYMYSSIYCQGPQRVASYFAFWGRRQVSCGEMGDDELLILINMINTSNKVTG